MTGVRTVKCPQCGAAVPWSPASKWRPFCSERCKTLDLGAWASEAYRVPVYAIGGLSPADLSAAIDHGAHGVALRRRAWP